jgi:hypothetical protein
VDRARGVGDRAAALLAPRAYDVTSTSLLLSEPPLRVPGWQRPVIRAVGRTLARRFTRSYQGQAAATVTPGELTWHQAVVCLRALVEVAGWVRQDAVAPHAGTPVQAR